MPKTAKELLYFYSPYTHDEVNDIEKAYELQEDFKTMWYSQEEYDSLKEENMQKELWKINNDLTNWQSIEVFKSKRPFFYDWLINNGFVYVEELDKWNHTKKSDLLALKEKIDKENIRVRTAIFNLLHSAFYQSLPEDKYVEFDRFLEDVFRDNNFNGDAVFDSLINAHEPTSRVELEATSEDIGRNLREDSINGAVSVQDSLSNDAQESSRLSSPNLMKVCIRCGKEKEMFNLKHTRLHGWMCLCGSQEWVDKIQGDSHGN